MSNRIYDYSLIFSLTLIPFAPFQSIAIFLSALSVLIFDWQLNLMIKKMKFTLQGYLYTNNL